METRRQTLGRQTLQNLEVALIRGVKVVAERDGKDEAEERIEDDCGWKSSDSKTTGNTRHETEELKLRRRLRGRRFTSASAF